MSYLVVQLLGTLSKRQKLWVRPEKAKDQTVNLHQFFDSWVGDFGLVDLKGLLEKSGGGIEVLKLVVILGDLVEDLEFTDGVLQTLGYLGGL